MPINYLRDKFPAAPTVDLGDRTSRQYMDDYDRRKEVMGVFRGSPWAPKDPGQVAQGTLDAYLTTIMELPMAAMDYLLPDDPYTPGVLQEGRKGEMRAQGRHWAELMQEKSADPGYALGQDYGTGLGMVADPFIDAPLAGVPALGKLLKLQPDMAAKPAAGMLGSLLTDEAGAIRAYHGTPHEVDKFRMANIGTGEGAQVYGHGLYFAENPAVAKEYMNALSRDVPSVNGDVVRTPDESMVHTIMQNWGSDIDTIKETIDTYIDGGVFKGADIESKRNALYEVAERFAGKEAGTVKQGSVYEVKLDVEPEDLLDWDAPVDWDSPLGQSIATAAEDHGLDIDDLRDIMGAPGSGYEGQPESGDSIYSWLSGSLGGDEAASKFLSDELGIQGIRYFDHGSRAAGEGSRNVVMFDEDLINILGRE